MSTVFRPTVYLLAVPLSRRGSTAMVLDNASGTAGWPDYSSILYIAPTPRKLRDAQKIFHALPAIKSPYIPPRFATLKQLAQETFESGMRGKTISPSLIPLLLSGIADQSIGYSCILADLMKELKQHHPGKNMKTIRAELSDFFRDLGIPDDVRRRMEEALSIFRIYEEKLGDLKLYDEDDLLNFAGSDIAPMPRVWKSIILDGFYEMTPVEKNVFLKLTEKAETVTVTYPSGDYTGDITDDLTSFVRSSFPVKEDFLKCGPLRPLEYISFSGLEEEIEGVAHDLREKFQRGIISPDSWIVVTFPKAGDFMDLTERVFKRHGIPYTVSLQKPFLRRTAIRDVIHLLQSVSEDFPRTKFTSALLSPYFAQIPEAFRKILPSLSLKSGIVKGERSWRELLPQAAGKEKAGFVSDVLADLFMIMGPLILMQETASVSDFCRATEDLLKKLTFTADKEDWKTVSKTFGALSTLDEISGGTKITLNAFTDYLLYSLTIPEYRREEAGVQIMDFQDSRALEPDLLYFCGLRDGDMPSKPPLDHVLPDSVRSAYGLSDLRSFLSVQKLNFLRLVESSAIRHLSYTAREGDRAYLPSSFLPWEQKTSGAIKLSGPNSGGKMAMNQWFVRQVAAGKKIMQKLNISSASLPFRVTDIDSYVKCPRRFFTEKVLRLEASVISEYEVEARLLGTITHKVMENLMREFPGDLEAFQDRAPELIREVMKKQPIDRYWKSIITEALIEMLPGILDLETEIRKGGYGPCLFEETFTAEVLPGISLKGKVDRIDRSGASFRVIDYKTGSVAIGSSTIRKGEGIQLPLYAAMLRAQGMEVEKAGVYSLGDLKVKWIPTKRDSRSISDYINSSLGFLKESVTLISEGFFIAKAYDDFYCRSCSEAPFCPYIHPEGSPSDD